MSLTITMFYEIRGSKNERCILYLRRERLVNNLDQASISEMEKRGASESEIQAAKAKAAKFVKQFEDQDGTCFFKTKALVKMLERWKNGEISTQDWNGASCTGTMFPAAR